MKLSAFQARLLLVLVTLLAFGARVYQLAEVPPGWSDDELSNVLVIAQKPLRGDFSVYYTDATGLEALYHAVSAVPLVLFGYNALGIRLLSVVLGTLTVPLTYQVGRRLFGSRLVALLAAAFLAVSFWSLIYSRVNLRHVSAPFFMLLTYYFFWAGLQAKERSSGDPATMSPRIWRLVRQSRHLAAAGLFLGLGCYTYFASRGVPLILAAFCLYLAFFHRARFRSLGTGLGLMFVTAAVVALPLVITVMRESGADARVAEVAAPLTEALDGDFTRLQNHIVRTLRMFDADGDDEFLYNIPHRPVFGPLGAFMFWAGAATALAYVAVPLLRRRQGGQPSAGAVQRQLGAAFLLLWWLAGITPGFLSVPAGSLGHTILAQSASYLLVALPVLPLQQLGRRERRLAFLALLAGVLLLISGAHRDLSDYFFNWPAQGNVRFLYRADLRNASEYLEENPTTNVSGITGLLSGPWDRLAMAMEQGREPLVEAQAARSELRWFDPQRAILLETGSEPATVLRGYPIVETVYEQWYQAVTGAAAGGYSVARVTAEYPEAARAVCFENGMCWIGQQFDPASGLLDLVWRVERPLTLPETELVSKPPPPGVYDGPRLAVFAQWLDQDGSFLAGDDGLWVDAATLQPGDVFMQQHRLPPRPTGDRQAGRLLIGLYDPMTGIRIHTLDGKDSIRLDLSAPPAD